MKKNKLPEWGYKLLKPILSPIFKWYYNPTIINKEYIPKNGPIIIVGNHKHIMDQCSIIISTKRIVHYMAKKEYFGGHFKWFFKITGCISVNRSIHDGDAKEKALSVLMDGGAIGLFSEGTRNKTTAVLLPFKYGAVSMAQKTGATIVPFGITGDYKFRSKNLTVRFGEPFKVDNMTLEDANKKLEQTVKDLIEY
jgi:1-acyl-sn-glycerol-3-phosphate acyltransferase